MCYAHTKMIQAPHLVPPLNGRDELIQMDHTTLGNQAGAISLQVRYLPLRKQANRDTHHILALNPYATDLLRRGMTKLVVHL